ncbi:unnamed protein product [Caenorhabditis angaria]|uniref:Uncharacterized protein n=1 Tax=Caenorhabditis angaria TaxID=860376 RepID=A0A9P1N5P4_9PELO|nr:unnamed protein product [Caenorhabditis angaria]
MLIFRIILGCFSLIGLGLTLSSVFTTSWLNEDYPMYPNQPNSTFFHNHYGIVFLCISFIQCPGWAIFASLLMNIAFIISFVPFFMLIRLFFYSRKCQKLGIAEPAQSFFTYMSINMLVLAICEISAFILTIADAPSYVLGPRDTFSTGYSCYLALGAGICWILGFGISVYLRTAEKIL